MRGKYSRSGNYGKRFREQTGSPNVAGRNRLPGEPAARLLQFELVEGCLQHLG
jgi:hypothetical protein